MASALVTHVGDALDALVLDKVGYGFYKHALVYHVRYFGNDNSSVFFFYSCLGANGYSSFSRRVGVNYAFSAVNCGISREIGSFYEVHKVGNRAIGVFHKIYGAVNYLAEVVRRNIGRHTDGNSHASVYEEVWKSRRENDGLFAAVVEVRCKIDNFLFYIAHKLVCEL